MTEVESGNTVQLLISIIHIGDFIYQPGITIGIGILYRDGLTALQGQNKVLSIQHIQHRKNRISLYQCHITLRLSNSTECLLHLLRDIGIDEFLITAQLGGMIASNALHVETRLILVERIRGKVQHTEIECLVLQNMIDGGRFLDGFLTNVLRHKHLIVQVPLVDLPHIKETEDGEDAHKPFGTQFPILIQ